MTTPKSPYIWTEYNESGKRRWSRQLGGHEAAFYWDSELSGACDVLSNTHIAVEASQSHLLTNEERVQRVWRGVKRRHPLLAASILESDTSQSLRFLIKEERIEGYYPGEVQFRVAETMEEYSGVCALYNNGPRLLTPEFVSRLIVLKVPGPIGDARLHYHIFIASSHAITDALASFNVTRTFLELLSRGIPEAVDITQRLTMVPAIDIFFTDEKSSSARRRWRRAVAQLIIQRRMGKMQGGTIIPNRVTTESLFQPALFCNKIVSLDAEETQKVLATCRSQGITFGHAFHVLCQLANASIIRDVRFSEREWEYRKRQPSHFFSPLNIRPFLDKYWLKNGGMSEVLTTGSVYQCTLPFLPLENPHHEMLSKKRFFYRCRLAKNEMDLQLRHPLLLDFAALYAVAHEAERRRVTRLWRERQNNKGLMLVEGSAEDEKFSSASQVSTFGALESLLPRTYPIQSKQPFITVISNTTWARAFPGQFYTTSGAWEGRLQIMSIWDGNTYEDDMVIRWLNNLIQFTRDYLVDSERSIGTRTRL